MTTFLVISGIAFWTLIIGGTLFVLYCLLVAGSGANHW
jgi:hypothetical protein